MNDLRQGISARLVEIRKALKLTQEELGQILHKGKSAIFKYEDGESMPPVETLKEYARLGQKSMDWIFCGHETRVADPAINYLPELSTDHVRINIYSMAGAGAPHTLTEYEPIDTLTIPTKLMKTGIVPVKVRGRSMEPNIFNGAIVGIDTTDRALVSGEIYGIWLPFEGAVIRRVTMSFDHITLQPDNEMFAPQEISTDRIDENFVLGRVRWILQEI